MPADAHALARFKLCYSFTKRIHDSYDFVSRDARKFKARPISFFHHRIAVANTTGLYF